MHGVGALGIGNLEKSHGQGYGHGRLTRGYWICGGWTRERLDLRRLDLRRLDLRRPDLRRGESLAWPATGWPATVLHLTWNPGRYRDKGL